MKGYLTKRGTKYWYYLYYPPRPPGSPGKAKQKKVALKTADKREAEILARKIWDRDLDIALGIARPEMRAHKPLRDLLNEYRTYIENRPDVKPKSKLVYLDTCKYLEQICGDIYLEGLTTHFIRTVVKPAMESRFGSLYTARRHMGNVRTLMGFAFEAGYIDKNPFTGHKGLIPKPPPRMPVSYTEEQINELVLHLKSGAVKQWQRTFFLLMLNTGMRLSEAVWLEHTHCRFEMDKPFIHLQSNTKGGKQRFVAANRVVLDEIATLPQQGPRVFWMIKNNNAARSAYARIREELPWLKRLHDLRSNRTSWLIWNGQNFQSVMDQMGWSDQETANMYRAVAANFAPSSAKETVWG